MGDMISYPCPDGSSAKGYLAKAAAPKGSLVLIQEWWGLNDQIKRVADRFADAGFTTLAPDLYDGRVTQDADEASHMMTGLDFPGAANQDIRGALQFLKSDGGKAAVLGFCMGGALTIIAGVKLSECDAAVCYYGIPPKEAADPAQMRVPFLGHFATQDDWCTPEAVAALKQDLAQVETPVEIYEYDGEHGFFNDNRTVYNKAASDLSWSRSIAFLERTLG
ncbi:MAG: dienelactone hydrolase family protein [Pseudomonadota bacterium]|nr:dienelactone hydrolase family protein [Pseudomonadota bacterium]